MSKEEKPTKFAIDSDYQGPREYKPYAIRYDAPADISVVRLKEVKEK